MKWMNKGIMVCAICGLVFNMVSAWAVVQPAGIFTDGVVLQQGEPVRIWGTAAAGEKVVVKFAEQVKETKADEAGNWMVSLDKLAVSAKGRPLVIQGSETGKPLEMQDVVVGEVWLAGGQSNMASTMQAYFKTTQPDIDRANDSMLRMVTVPRLEFAGQNEDRPVWKKSQPQNVRGFSASAYYFAKNLREVLDIPIGIISCSVGATPAEAWMSRKTLESQKDLKRILDAYEAGYRREFSSDEEYRKQYEEYLAAQKEYLQEWRKVGKRAGPYPQQAMGPFNYKRPCGLHETMLTQVIPATVRGVIWYQGENNAVDQNGFYYRRVFSTLIQEWREEFKNPDMPFLFVQLATLGPAENTNPYWPELRESQSWVAEQVPDSGMIVMVDGGEIDNIHPHSKDKVGYRLSLLARNRVYGEKKLICQGPTLKKMNRKKEAIELTFETFGSGLVLKPEAVGSFEICGEDGHYIPAEAKRMDGKIIVSAKGILKPQNVRYGWKQWFIPTLFNAEGLPASPFRTDDFPAVTKGRYYLDGAL